MLPHSQHTKLTDSDNKTVSNLSIRSVHTNAKQVKKDMNSFEYYQEQFNKLLKATKLDLEQAKVREAQPVKGKGKDTVDDAKTLLKGFKDGKDAGAQYFYMKYEFEKRINQEKPEYIFIDLKFEFKRPSVRKFLIKINQDPTNPLHFMNAGLCKRLKDGSWDTMEIGLCAILIGYLLADDEKLKSEILDILKNLAKIYSTERSTLFLEFTIALLTGKPTDSINQQFKSILDMYNTDAEVLFKNSLEYTFLPQKEHELLRLEIWKAFLALREASSKNEPIKTIDQKSTRKKATTVSSQLFYNSNVTNDNLSSASNITPHHSDKEDSDKEDSDYDSISYQQDETDLDLNDLIEMRVEIIEMQKRFAVMEKKLTHKIEQRQSANKVKIEQPQQPVTKVPSVSTSNKKG